MEEQKPNTDPLTFDRPTRTDMHCTECSKHFIALLDYAIDGNHIIECAHCGHEHCRVITKGKITEERWSSRYGSDKTRDGIQARRVWKSNDLPAVTSSAAEFLRQRWLEKYS
jgi:DNA-directed RNA polymerase subunit RPC12/RpoP